MSTVALTVPFCKLPVAGRSSGTPGRRGATAAPRTAELKLTASNRRGLVKDSAQARGSRNVHCCSAASSEGPSVAVSTDAPFTPITGQTVVITGATGGIGLEFCKQLLEKGNTVVATCRAPTSSLADLSTEYPDSFIVTILDVSSPDSIRDWAKKLATNIDHVGVCINNAGTTGLDGYQNWDLENVTAEDMMHVFQINAVAPTLIVQQLLKNGLLGGEDSPSLVGNVTSKVGSVDDNSGGRGYAYRASKSALNNINKSMSIDLEPENVTCVLLHPGWVRTAMTEGRGLIDADESAAGMIAVMEGAAGNIRGRWYDYKLEAIPW